MTALQHAVKAAIKAHQKAVLADEGSFDDHHNPVSEELAEQTGAAEVAAFKVMATAPCSTHDEVQAKLRYVLDGSVGVRTPIIECLGDEEYGAWEGFEAFLRSLVLPQESAR
ncbi:hypothetical protein M0654_03575 [Rhizobium sp. NTR19]|uniref:Uncharacterized protein n=1 Tax=Neorhizobium turbinariae TaxID=2937795 RepID=A0ABT0IMG5_9HYPH|nr:hypothetical protein [Neorhizobium turbinariae]MCK8779059.1 hypothetical protein [Neorhizobium turbinariae]